MKLSANKKKVIVLCSMVLLLIVAGTLNVVLNLKAPDANPGGDVATTFFSAHRADRESRRAEQISYLDSIITNASSTKEAVSAAETQKLELCTNMEKELVFEGLIKAKGYDDAVVIMSKDNVNVVIKKDEFNTEDAARILGIITAQTSYNATQVVLVPYQNN